MSVRNFVFMVFCLSLGFLAGDFISYLIGIDTPYLDAHIVVTQYSFCTWLVLVLGEKIK